MARAVVQCMRPDSNLQNKVMHALALDPHVDETAIGVSVRHGIVTLDGIVSSYGERDTATAVAHRVPGVLDVANELVVRPGRHAIPTDSELAEAVRNALAAAPTVPHEQIQTTVSGHGHVTLTGAVRTLRQLEAADAAVRRLRGVVLLTNSIAVWPPELS